MNKIQILFKILLYLNVLISSKSLAFPKGAPVFTCKRVGDVCTFENVVLTSTNYNWAPTADNVNLVGNVKFTSSFMPVLTESLCDAFPALHTLQLYYLNIQEVAEGAFYNCRNLKVLKLHRNSIKGFHPNTFSNTKNIKELYFPFNRIARFDLNTFQELQELTDLDLGGNNLTEFSPKLLQFNQKLVNLHLPYNDLSDLEVEKIVDSHPNLKLLRWEDNEVSCNRAVDALNYLRSKNIAYTIYTSDYKVRYYPTQMVFDWFICNPDISWMAAEYRKAAMRQNKLLG